MFDAADFALFGAALPPIAKEFGLGPAQAGFVATVGLVGAFVGALFWGTISDYIGRRTSFSATIGIFALFTGLVAASWNILSLQVFRFLSNFGLGGEVPVTSTLGSEFSPGRLRGTMTGGIMAAFPVGLALAALLSLLIIPNFGWRALFVVGVVPAVLLLFVRRYMPESVRFLLSKGRVAKAERTVAEIERQAAEGHLPQPKSPPAQAPADVAEPGVTVAQLLAPRAAQAHHPALDRVVRLSLVVEWHPVHAADHPDPRGLPLNQILVSMLVQALAAIVGYALCGFLVDRYGRRIVLFLYFFIGAFFHLWFAEASGIWLYFAAAAIGWVNPGVYGATSVYVAELHPTRLRATAVGWFFGIGRIGSFLAPAVVGLMLANGLGHYVLHTFALSFLLASIALWFVGVETKGKTLEEITRGGAVPVRA